MSRWTGTEEQAWKENLTSTYGIAQAYADDLEEDDDLAVTTFGPLEMYRPAA